MTATIALRFALYADLAILFGLPVFGLATPAEGRFGWRRWIAGAAAAGGLLAAAALLAMASGMTGEPIARLDPALVGSLVGDTAIGLAFRVRMVALAAALIVGLAPRIPPRPRLAAAAACGGVALASLAWTGHGAMDEGAAGWAHLGADIVHLLAAGIWIGALVALLLLACRDLRERDAAVAALHGFGRLGSAVVAALAATGAVNIWMLLVRPGAALLPPNAYALLLAAKLLAFAAMLGLAGLNRWWMTARLARGGHGIRYSLCLELALGMVALALVAALGTLAPTGA